MTWLTTSCSIEGCNYKLLWVRLIIIIRKLRWIVYHVPRGYMPIPSEWIDTIIDEAGIALHFLDEGACVETSTLLLFLLYIFFLSHAIKLFLGFIYLSPKLTSPKLVSAFKSPCASRWPLAPQSLHQHHPAQPII